MSAGDVGIFIGGALVGGFVVGAVAMHVLRKPQAALAPPKKKQPPPYKPRAGVPPVSIDYHQGHYWVQLNRPGRAETSYPSKTYADAKAEALHMAWPDRPIVDYTKGGTVKGTDFMGTYRDRTGRPERR